MINKCAVSWKVRIKISERALKKICNKVRQKQVDNFHSGRDAYINE